MPPPLNARKYYAVLSCFLIPIKCRLDSKVAIIDQLISHEGIHIDPDIWTLLSSRHLIGIREAGSKPRSIPAFMAVGIVYTAGAIGVKQDVTLQHYIGDNLKYGYELELAIRMRTARKSVAIAIYGTSLPLNATSVPVMRRMRRCSKKLGKKLPKINYYSNYPRRKSEKQTVTYRPLPLNMS